MLRIPAYQTPYDHVHVIFSHPGIHDGNGNPDKLVVKTGADNIAWSYNLNTQKYQTYGGEVIQILSANIGALTIEGTVRDYTELDEIYGWFKKYIFNLRGANINNPETIASKTSSGQQPVKIQYPHRGWEWDVYIREAPGYRMGRDVVAPNWKVVCEFFHPEDKEDLEVEIKNSFTEALTNDVAPLFILNKNGLRRIYNDPFPLPSGGDVEFVDPAEIAATMGDHFQRLIAAWGFGDFAKFAYDTSGFDENVAGLSKTFDDYAKEVYGADVIQLGTADTAGGGTGGGTTGFSASWPGNGASSEARALWLAAKAQEAGLPPVLPVMAALVESGMQNLDHGDRDSVGLFQMRTGIWDTGAYRGYPNNVDLQMKWFVDRAKEEQTAAGRDGRAHSERNANLDDAGQLGKWADDIERSAFPDRYQAKYTEAKGYIADLANYVQQNQGSAGGGGGNISGTVREKIVYWANYCEQHKDEILYGQGNSSFPRPRSGQTSSGDLDSKPAGTLPFSTDCSAFVGLCYKWAGAPLPPGGWLCATGSMQGAPARTIAMSDALPGDYIIYGSGAGHHVEIVIAQGALPQCISHGQDSGPEIRTARSDGRPFRCLPEGTT